MLAPDSRALLLESLRPPLGHRLDAAVATTFTLDFTAALVAPLAFAAHEVRASTDPVAILEAVRSSADRVDVFCQAGQIRVPLRPSDLMTFLEPMIHEVRRPRPGHLFHPKVWVLRYASPEGGSAFRLLCLTRNLTSDTSWDAILRLDGTAGNRIVSDNSPLVRFVRALPAMALKPLPPNRLERIESLAEGLRRVVWERPDAVTDIAFHPLGLPGARSVPSFKGYRRLVVAPFVNDGGLNIVAPGAGTETVLVSRAEDLNRLAPETVEALDCRVVSTLAGLSAAAENDNAAADDQFNGGLHAKLFVVERDRLAHVFVGSANATDAAFNGNVEFLVELVGGATKLGVNRFVDADEGFAGLLEGFVPEYTDTDEPEDELARTLEQLLRELAEARFRLTVEPAESWWSLTLACASALHFPPGIRVTAALLTRPAFATELQDAHHGYGRFEGLDTPDITPFVVLRASGSSAAEGDVSRATVVRATLLNDPAGRLDEVLARQVDTPEKFLRFLFLLLGLGGGPGVTIFGPAPGAGPTGSWTGRAGSGVFEILMRALADQPEALEDLDRLVSRLRATEKGQGILPLGFQAVWETVNAARLTLAKRGTRRTA